MSGLKWLFLELWDEFKTLISLGPTKSRGQNQNYSHTNHPNQRAKNPRHISAIGTTRRAVIDIPEPPNHETDSEARTKEGREKLHLRFQIGAAIAVIIGFPILAIQSCANLLQANAAKGQLEEMRKENILSERAWIYIDVENNSMDREGDLVVIRATMKNTGKTPAIVTGSATFSSLTTNDISRSIKNPNGSYMVINPDSTAYVKLPLFPWTVNALTNGLPVYVFGTVFYNDIYGNEHWSECCYSVAKSGREVTRMLFHNSCDDLEKVKNER